jgi:hypothetical protein
LSRTDHRRTEARGRRALAGPCEAEAERKRRPAARAARRLDDWQTWLLEQRADYQQHRDQAAAAGQDTAELDELLAELDDELAKTGIRGKPDPSSRKSRRHRTTRRRQDAPDLPRRKVAARTTGKTYTAPGGKAYKP